MSQDLLNLGANQRVDLRDMLYLAQTQPLGLQADLTGALLSRARQNNEMWVLHGFSTTLGSTANQLVVAPGAALLAWRQGGGNPLYGVLAPMDGPDSQPQTLSLSTYPSGSYAVWLRLTYQQSSLADRAFWNAASPGFEYSQSTAARLHAGWEVQALAAGSNPGAEWLQIATVTFTAPATQGGAGTFGALSDARPLYFEGNPGASPAYSGGWGSATDRSANRGINGVGDLRTFVAAMQTCLEDVKGPGLRRWYEPGIGGINIGFSPAAPVAGRLAVGDASLYLQGRTAGDANNSYLVVNKNQTTGAYDGLWHNLSTNTAKWMLQTGLPLLTLSGRYGTLGVGNLADIDLAVSPGRALAEFVTSTSGQTTLRLGARAANGAVPVNMDAALNIVAPDQANNNAQVLFSHGGIQGPERLLYRVGKGVDNGFYITDVLNSGTNLLAYSTASRGLQFNIGAYTQFDVTNNVAAVSYDTSTRTTTFAGKLSGQGNFSVAGNAIFGSGINDPRNGNALVTPGAGGATFSGTLYAKDNLISFGGAIVYGTTITTNLNVTGNVSLSNGLTAPSYTVAGATTFVGATYITLPTINDAPANVPFGTIAYFPNRDQGRIYCYTKKAFDTEALGDNGLPRGWQVLQQGN